MKNNIGDGRNFPPINPTFFEKATSYIILCFMVVPSMFILMRILNRMRIIGKKNATKLDRPWILMSNHVTLLDDMFLGPFIFWPRGLRGYAWIPIHAPEEKNFYKVPIIAWFMRRTKSIPVMRGKGIHQEGVSRLIAAVRNGGVLHIYPEGTRTRTGEIGSAKIGIGRIVYESGAPVVPMYHRGLEGVLPIGAGVPRFGKRVYVSIGEALQFDEERKLPNTPETWRLIVEKIMSGITAERDKLSQLIDKEVS